MSQDRKTSNPAPRSRLPVLRRIAQCRLVSRALRQETILANETYRLATLVATIMLLGILVIALWHVLIGLGPVLRDGDDWIFMPIFAMPAAPALA